MNLIFFQNCVSPHQMPYIAELPAMDGVTSVRIVAPRWSYDERKAMGWGGEERAVPDGVEVVVAPTDDAVRGMLRDAASSPAGAVCLFSGISAFPEVAAWLEMSRRYRVRRAIVTEPPFTFGRPLWMHRLRFLLMDLRRVSAIDYVFAIGAGCADYYRSWSRRWRVVPFMYATAALTPELSALVDASTGDTDVRRTGCRMAFVGAVDKRKNLAMLIDALALMTYRNAAALAACRLTVVGDGPELDGLRWRCHDVGLDTVVHFVGTKPMSEVPRLLAAQDYLVLPSLHDGWGAVVSEALTLGVWPIVSDHVGARQVIADGENGTVFAVGDTSALEQTLESAVGRVAAVRASRRERIAWAARTIAPRVVAQTMLEALTK